MAETTTQLTGTTTPQYLSLQQAAQIASVSVDTLRRWIEAGRLTRYRPCRKVLVRLDELEELLAASK